MSRKSFLAVFFVILTSFSLAWAQDPEIEQVESSPPDGLSEKVRNTLDSSALRVSVGGSIMGEFWFRKELPLSDGGSAPLGVAFGQIARGTLVGALRLDENWSDYKEGPVRGGAYTLRYGIQPEDGEHLGVSLYRDFLMIIPGSEDVDPEGSFSSDDLVDLSKKSSGADHPAVLSLFPLYEEVAEPTVLKNEMDQWMVAVPLGSLILGLVIEGHGEVE